jgi:hypothetical protein
MMTTPGLSGSSRSRASRRLARTAITLTGGTRAPPCVAISACSSLSRVMINAFMYVLCSFQRCGHRHTLGVLGLRPSDPAGATVAKLGKLKVPAGNAEIGTSVA